MALAQADVDAFMAVEKVVPGNTATPMKWAAPVPTRRIWRGPVEVAGGRVGEIFLLANPSLPRAWTFKLDYHGEKVYRIDVKPAAARHCNLRACPEGFPNKVRNREHEHVYVEGLSDACARPIEGFESSDHRAIFDEFCRRARIVFNPAYISPLLLAQMQMPI